MMLVGRTIWWIVGGIVGLLAVGGAVVYTALSYVTSAGDETRWGVRVARRLGIKGPAVPYVFIRETEILQRGELNGLVHLALIQLSAEDRQTALAYFNIGRQARGFRPITDSDLARFTEGFRQAALLVLSPQERTEVLASLNEHRAAMGLEPIAEGALSLLL